MMYICTEYGMNIGGMVCGGMLKWVLGGGRKNGNVGIKKGRKTEVKKEGKKRRSELSKISIIST